jgi:hypothetical protein
VRVSRNIPINSGLGNPISTFSPTHQHKHQSPKHIGLPAIQSSITSEVHRNGTSRRAGPSPQNSVDWGKLAHSGGGRARSFGDLQKSPRRDHSHTAKHRDEAIMWRIGCWAGLRLWTGSRYAHVSVGSLGGPGSSPVSGR